MAAAKGGENMQKIDLTTLSLPQLAQLKQQLEQVFRELQSHFHLLILLLYNNE